MIMNTLSYIKYWGITVLAIIVSAFLFVSCDGMIYNDEGDCSVRYRLKFRYDMNPKFADAFAHEVKSVRLYAFTPDGELVWQSAEQGSVLASEEYAMPIDLAPGDYHLVAWCGLDNEESFTLPDVSHGCHLEDLHCKLKRQYDMETDVATGAQKRITCSKQDLHPLFHGTLDVSLPVNDDGGEYTYVMPLTKDTNIFRVVLQHLSGEDINADDFVFSIEDRNGWMAHDNSLINDEPITYRAWSTYSGEAGVDIPTKAGADVMPGAGKRVITTVKAAVAELTVSRLVKRDWSQYPRPMLTIRTTEGKLVVSIPVIDYALLVRGECNRSMSEQEFLDRADEYNMTFFLDEDNKWVSTVIQILSWKVVRSNVDIE